MTVTQYERRFVDLCRHAAIFIPTKREKVQRFIKGLTYCIRLQMFKEVDNETSFTQEADISRRIERIRGQGREATSIKCPRHFGGFIGAFSRSKGHFGKGHDI